MKVCISCQENVEGKNATKIKEDKVIRTIRKIKKLFNIAQMNELYVCEKDIAEHTKKRHSFEKSMLFVSVFAGIILIIMVGGLLISGQLELVSIVSAIIIAGFVLFLPLFKYAPALESGVASAVQQTTKLNEPTKKLVEPKKNAKKEKPKNR